MDPDIICKRFCHLVRFAAYDDVWIDYFRVSLHTALTTGICMFMVVKYCQRLLKNDRKWSPKCIADYPEISTGEEAPSPNLHQSVFQMTTPAIGNRVSYSTDSPIATRLGPCNSLVYWYKSPSPVGMAGIPHSEYLSLQLLRGLCAKIASNIRHTNQRISTGTGGPKRLLLVSDVLMEKSTYSFRSCRMIVIYIKKY